MFAVLAVVLGCLAGFDVTAGDVSAFDFLAFAVTAIALHLVYPIAVRR